MGWFSRLIEGPSPTFEQDLELLVARWTDRSKKGDDARSLSEIADGMLLKAEQLSEASYKNRRQPIINQHTDKS